ncbi:hypothetical protein TCCBUS3UF1_21840 [Thermus sp. CCB_US3_UF1]|uniref:hypothetical protein n=1 Tax=Thermus sp. CCB_US3_UF1 TaxID=1111069 RepID=UPI0002389343|nr:hypothetical protein [Thermus sp. CCB_US3_UF1]AEV17220.1 hypothetical protein TCCBUS3UF1_21840 [Thermus sp. CCB_US3_UF1]
MKRSLFLLLFGLWTLAAGLPQAYDRLAEALAQVRLGNPTQALAALDRAQGILRQEAEGLPPVLRDAALANLQEARQAVLRRSQVDLEARLLLVRHLVGKALYDGFFQAPPQEKPPYLTRLARATGLPAALVQGMGNLSPEEARRRLEGHYLQGMAEDLARALDATSRPQAYLALARAYARYLVIQDSPQSTLKAQDFVQTLAKVSGGEAFRPEVGELQKKVAAWRQALVRQTPPVSAAPASPTPTPSASNPTPASPSPSSPPAPTPSPSQVRLAESLLPQEIREETSLLRLDPEIATKVGEALQRLAIPSLVNWLDLLDEVRSSLAQAQLYTETGQYQRARAQLAYAYSRFRLKVYPVVGAYAPELAERTDRLFLRMQEAVGLRTVDFAVLLGEIQEIEERLLGGSLGFWHALQVQIQLFLLGIPRAVFFLLAAALAFFPLYLIRLTFGGRNVYWNLLGLAFLFLVLPIMTEGLSYMGSILAEYGGLPILGLLANLSIAQALVAYLAWGLSAFLVVAFAGAGLRGIAAQFGLLKERGAEVAASEERPATTLTSETIVEWDEEF